MLASLSNLKAIFFDMDNVLVFSEMTHGEAWKKTLQTYGIHPDQLDYQEMAGKSDSVQADEIIQQFSLPQDASTLCQIKTNHFIRLAEKGFEVPKGRDAFLQKVAQRYITAVVSSSFQQVVDHIIAQENMADHFQFTIAYEDCEKIKPDPFPYQLALRKSNIAPHEALVIEDSFSGITAALKANIPVIGIFKDQTPDQKIQGVRYFNDFTEIDTWLSHLNAYAYT